jgi:hypothetical protein
MQRLRILRREPAQGEAIRLEGRRVRLLYFLRHTPELNDCDSRSFKVAGIPSSHRRLPLRDAISWGFHKLP